MSERFAAEARLSSWDTDAMAKSSGWFMGVPGSGGSSRLVRSTWAARSWEPFRRTGGFRTVELNAVGWLAVLAPGGFAGFIFGLVTNKHVLAMILLGVVAAWGVGLIVDYSKWRQSGIGFDITDLSENDRLQLVTRLEHDGIPFEIEHRLMERNQQYHFLNSTMSERRRIEAILRREESTG